MADDRVTRRQMWASFVHGFFAGVGGVVGATLGVAALLFLLQHFGAHLPLVGQYFQQLSETINKAKR